MARFCLSTAAICLEILSCASRLAAVSSADTKVLTHQIIGMMCAGL
jgi:hypothetical protein